MCAGSLGRACAAHYAQALAPPPQPRFASWSQLEKLAGKLAGTANFPEYLLKELAAVLGLASTDARMPLSLQQAKAMKKNGHPLRDNSYAVDMAREVGLLKARSAVPPAVPPARPQLSARLSGSVAARDSAPGRGGE